MCPHQIEVQTVVHQIRSAQNLLFFDQLVIDGLEAVEGSLIESAEVDGWRLVKELLRMQKCEQNGLLSIRGHVLCLRQVSFPQRGQTI